MLLDSYILSTTHQCWESGHNIKEPIQIRFGTSWVRRVYFLRKSIEFHDMRTECQRINNSRSFLTVLLIYHKFPAITQSLAPQYLPNRSPIPPQSVEAVLSNFFLVSEAENLNPPSKLAFSCSCYLFSEWTFKFTSHRRSIRLTMQTQPTKRSDSSTCSIDTSLSTYRLTKTKRSKITLLFGSTFRQWPVSSLLLKPSPSVNIFIPL